VVSGAGCTGFNEKQVQLHITQLMELSSSNLVLKVSVLHALIFLYNKLCWSFGHHLLLRDFEPYVMIFMNECITNIAMIR
jgi:hypothetical protein